MNTFIQLVVNGLGKGAVFALLALGFVIIFKASGVVNFAHGSFVLLGGYLVVRTEDDLGWAGASVLGIVVRRAAGAGRGTGAAVAARGTPIRSPGAADHRRRRDHHRGDHPPARRRGALPRRRRGTSKPIQVGDITLFRTQLIALVVAAVLVAAFFLAFRYSNWGVAMRAQAENREAAALMGIRRSRVTATAWVVAGVLAGVAVLFLATQDFSGAGLSRGTHAIALVAFPAAIIGGLDSTAGAIVGGLIVGLVEALSAQYISFEFSKSAVFIVMLAVLVVRPAGLFGTRERTRV